MDNVRPTTNISGNSTTDGVSLFSLAVTFGESVTGFDNASDVTISNGSVFDNISGSGANYTIWIQPSGGNVGVSIDANVAQDAAGNGNAATASSYNVSDNAAPALTISDNVSGTTSQSSITAYFAFSEAVTGFSTDDITVDNGSAGSLTQITADNYSMVITNISNNVVITVAANAASDDASNTGPADAVSHSVTYVDPDSTSPTIQIQDAPTTHDQSTGFSVTFAFSEAVQGFVADDVSLGYATISQFTTTDNISFTATITPTGAMDITIDVAANVAQDGTSNGNIAASTVTVRSNVVEETQELIDTSLKATISHIVSNQPSLGGFVAGGPAFSAPAQTGSGSTTSSGSEGAGTRAELTGTGDSGTGGASTAMIRRTLAPRTL